MFVCVAGRNDGYGRTQSDKRKILKLWSTSPGTGMARKTLEDSSVTGWYPILCQQQQGIIWENHLKKVLSVARWQSVESINSTLMAYNNSCAVLCCAEMRSKRCLYLRLCTPYYLREIILRWNYTYLHIIDTINSLVTLLNY